MIAGETEYIIHGGEDNYDYFLKNLFKKDPNKQAKPKRTAEEKAARKEQRQQWWGKQKENFQNAGGVEGITSTLGNIVGFFKDDTQRIMMFPWVDSLPLNLRKKAFQKK